MKKALLLAAISILSVSAAIAEEKPLQYSAPAINRDTLRQIKNQNIANDFLKIITYSSETKHAATSIDASKKYDEAKEKFAQGNITAAYRDFKDVVQQSKRNDFVNITLAYKLANLGFFSLSQEAILNIEDQELYKNQIELIKLRLYPKVALSYDEEIYLAQNFTEIYFNNLAFEIVREMSKKSDLLKKSDYANYILAQGYINLKEYGKAQNAINKAISMNQENANYQKIKAQIFCENNKLSDAIKVTSQLLSKNIDVMNYRKEALALKYFTLAKSTKDRNETKYYLANYFLNTGDTQRAIKELTQNISQNKKDYESLALLGEIYFKQKDFAKATDSYERAYKLKKSYMPALKGMGDLSFYKKEYKQALDFYIKAVKKDKKNPVLNALVARCYSILEQPEKSENYAQKAVAYGKNNAEVYYILSQLSDKEKEKYLKKAISANPTYADAWIDMAGLALVECDLNLAKKYLFPVKTLDPKNYRYNYYADLIKKKDIPSGVQQADDAENKNIKEVNDKI